MAVQFADGALWRVSKRGLVIGTPDGDTVLLEHPRAHQLPALLPELGCVAELVHSMGAPIDPHLGEQLLALGVLVEPGESTRADNRTPRQRAVTWSRSGVMFTGIARPSRWIDRHMVPALLSWPGRLMLAAVIAGGAVCLSLGDPFRPATRNSPAATALLLIAIGLVTTIAHELAHAVAMVHFGRTPRRAGFGFYWGAISFYVDSTPTLTLPRRERVIQALAGLATDVVTTATLAIAARAELGPLLTVVLWRRAVLDALGILLNALPILEVDGHWALADLLDEPELASRARGALAQRLRRRNEPGAGIGMALYGAVSLLAGFALIALAVYIDWIVLGGIILALFSGNVGDIVIGIYLIAPLILGLSCSVIGLLVESLTCTDPPSPAAA